MIKVHNYTLKSSQKKCKKKFNKVYKNKIK